MSTMRQAAAIVAVVFLAVGSADAQTGRGAGKGTAPAAGGQRTAPTPSPAPTPAPAPTAAPSGGNAITVDDVIQLQKANLSENIILARIKSSTRPAQISTADLVKLGQAKVSERVIEALMEPNAPAAQPGAAGAAAPAASSSSRAAGGNSPAASASSSTATSPQGITVRPVSLSKTQMDSIKKGLDAQSNANKPKGLSARLGGVIKSSVSGDPNKRQAAVVVLQQQAHDAVVSSKQTVIVVIGGNDVVTEVRGNLADVTRPILLLQLDPSVSDQNVDNSAIHDGVAGGLTGLADNLWVYLPKAAATSDTKPTQVLSTKTPGQKQLWTGIFVADGDTPPVVDKLGK